MKFPGRLHSQNSDDNRSQPATLSRSKSNRAEEIEAQSGHLNLNKVPLSVLATDEASSWQPILHRAIEDETASEHLVRSRSFVPATRHAGECSDNGGARCDKTPVAISTADCFDSTFPLSNVAGPEVSKTVVEFSFVTQMSPRPKAM